MPYSYTGKAGGARSMGGSRSSSGSSGGGFRQQTKTDHAAGVSSGSLVTGGTSGVKPNYTQKTYPSGGSSQLGPKPGTGFTNTTPTPTPTPKPVKQSALRIKRKKKERSSDRNKTKLGIGKSNVQPINAGVLEELNL